MTNAKERELSDAAVAAMSAIAKHVVTLAAENVPIGAVLERVIPGLARPLPKCPHCEYQWTVRNSRRIGSTQYVKQWMVCKCEERRSRVVSEQFAKSRKK